MYNPKNGRQPAAMPSWPIDNELSKRINIKYYCQSYRSIILSYIGLFIIFKRNKIYHNKLVRLGKCAFFVYVAHGILLAIMNDLSAKIIPMHDGWLVLQYFGVSIIGIIIFVIMGIVFKKLFPKIYGILTGGRI